MLHSAKLFSDNPSNNRKTWMPTKSPYYSDYYDDFWLYYKTKDDAPHGRYKFHISIHPSVFRKHETALHSLLHKALEDGLIRMYKTCNVDHKDCVKNPRQLHAPFIIYIKDEDANNETRLLQLGMLCSKIEKLLHNVPAGDENTQTECDLSISTHILFRQAYFNSDKKTTETERLRNYREANKHSNRLREEGLESNIYKTLMLHTLQLPYIRQIVHLIDILTLYSTLLGTEESRIFQKYGRKDDKYLKLVEKRAQIAQQIIQMNAIISNMREKYNLSDAVALQSQTEFLTVLTETTLTLSDQEKEVLYKKRETSYFFNSTKSNLTNIENEIKHKFDQIRRDCN